MFYTTRKRIFVGRVVLSKIQLLVMNKKLVANKLVANKLASSGQKIWEDNGIIPIVLQVTPGFLDRFSIESGHGLQYIF
jgi:hypothetical protein